MRAQVSAHRYKATRNIQSLKAYLDETQNTLLFVRCGSRNRFKVSGEPFGKSGKRNANSPDEATKSFGTLMLSFLGDYAGSTDPSVLQAISTIQTLCGPPWVRGSVIANTQQLRDAVNALCNATPAPATGSPATPQVPVQVPMGVQSPPQHQLPLFSSPGDAHLDAYLGEIYRIELQQMPPPTGNAFYDENLVELYKAGALPK